MGRTSTSIRILYYPKLPEKSPEQSLFLLGFLQGLRCGTVASVIFRYASTTGWVGPETCEQPCRRGYFYARGELKANSEHRCRLEEVGLGWHRGGAERVRSRRRHCCFRARSEYSETSRPLCTGTLSRGSHRAFWIIRLGVCLWSKRKRAARQIAHRV